MGRLSWTLAVIGAIGVASDDAAVAAEPPKPNVIVIYTDDQGYADLSCMGFERDVKTPHIDRLAAQGVRFTHGYVTAPRGFQETFCGQLNSYSATCDLAGNRFQDVRTVRVEGDRLDRQSDAAVRFIDIHHKQPFFLYLAYFAPHVPLAKHRIDENTLVMFASDTWGAPQADDGGRPIESAGTTLGCFEEHAARRPHTPLAVLEPVGDPSRTLEAAQSRRTEDVPLSRCR